MRWSSDTSAENHFADMSIPNPPVPGGNFVPFKRTGNLVYVSGQIPRYEDGSVIKGTLGSNISIEDGQKAAYLATLNLISQMRVACGGDLDKVKNIIKVEGFVKSTPEFTRHPKVINGCSDLLVKIFGKEVCEINFLFFCFFTFMWILVPLFKNNKLIIRTAIRYESLYHRVNYDSNFRWSISSLQRSFLHICENLLLFFIFFPRVGASNGPGLPHVHEETDGMETFCSISHIASKKKKKKQNKKQIGSHTRFAVGVNSLPLGVPVELCIIFEV